MTGERAPEIDWDLLEPTLSERDDFTGFSRPFSPWTVVVVVIFCRPVLGGLLLAWNAWRLGRPRQVPVLAVGGVLAASLVILIADATLQDPTPDQMDFLRFCFSASGGLLAAAFLPSHLRRFRLFQMCGGEPQSLWIPGIAFVVGAQFVNVPIYGWLQGVLEALL